MICIIDCGTSWLKKIKNNLNELGYVFKVIKLNQIKKYNPNSFSGIIISGAPTLLTKVKLEKYFDSFNFVKKINVPILGICLGHQIIGLLSEAKISRGKMINQKEYILIKKKDKLFSNIKNRALFREEHSEFITLPKTFYLLAKSDSCANEAMKHKTKAIYGVQFHPEMSGKEGKQFFKNFLSMCSK